MLSSYSYLINCSNYISNIASKEPVKSLVNSNPGIKISLSAYEGEDNKLIILALSTYLARGAIPLALPNS